MYCILCFLEMSYISHYVYIHVFSQGLWQFKVLPSTWPPWHAHVWKRTKLLSTEEIMNSILNPNLSEKQIWWKVPFGVNCNSVFLVDLSKLGTSRDIVCDDMRSWKWGECGWVWMNLVMCLSEESRSQVLLIQSCHTIVFGSAITRTNPVRTWRSLLLRKVYGTCTPHIHVC